MADKYVKGSKNSVALFKKDRATGTVTAVPVPPKPSFLSQAREPAKNLLRQRETADGEILRTTKDTLRRPSQRDPAFTGLSAEDAAEQDWGRRMKNRTASEVVELTQEAYDALNPEQRAAVDYNTAYYRAVQSDRALAESGTRPDLTQAEKYEEIMRGLFGENAGEGYAPNTAALLQSLGTVEPGANIDDYLELRGAISVSDLDELGDPRQPQHGGGAFARQDMAGRNRINAVVANTQGLLDQLRGDTGVAISLSQYRGSNFSTLVGQHIANAGLGIGEDKQAAASAAAVDSVVNGSGTTGENDFEQLFNYTVDRASDGQWSVEDLYSSLSEEGYDPKQYIDFVNERLQQYDRATADGYTVSLGRTVGGDYLTPQEYRARLGLS